MTARREQVSARQRYVGWSGPAARGGAAGRRSEQAYSAAAIFDFEVDAQRPWRRLAP